MKDRDAIYKAVSTMLDNPGQCGIYPTSTAFQTLESHVVAARVETLGWAVAYLCSKLDKGVDPRTIEIPQILAEMQRDLL